MNQTTENQQAWAIAREGRISTVRAAKSGLLKLKEQGLIGQLDDCRDYHTLIGISQDSEKLASKAPANFYLFYANRTPESFDGTADVAKLIAACIAWARKPVPHK